jgi:hypothetical protein
MELNIMLFKSATDRLRSAQPGVCHVTVILVFQDISEILPPPPADPAASLAPLAIQSTPRFAKVASLELTST